MNSTRRAIIASAATFALIASAIFVIVPTTHAATTKVLTITQASTNASPPFSVFDGNPPKVYDINGDGQMEILAQNDNQYLYIFDSKTGAILSQLRTKLPGVWDARTFNGPEVAIFEEGGVVRLVVVNSAAYVTLFRYDHPGSSATHFKWIMEWERRLSDCHSNPGSDSKPHLADLDKDGHLDIIATTEEVGTYVLRMDGTLGWKNCMSGGNAEATTADLNLDGWLDVIHVSDSGIVSALNGRSGLWLWSYNVPKNFNVGSASIPVAAGVGQLDGLAGPDVVIGARDSHDNVDYKQNHALLLALDSFGKPLWARQDPTGNPLTYTHPIIADVEGDGLNEVYWGDWNTIGHKGGIPEADAWKHMGPANYYRYDHQGNLVWKQTIGTFWSNKDLALADVDGDGQQEVLVNGPNANGHDGVWYLDARTGTKETHVSTYPFQLQRGAIVADLWGTGTTQWVVEVAKQGEGGGHGVLAFDTGAPYNAMWPHLPYPKVPPMPPAPPGSFDATFIVKSPGDWWQDVQVKPTTTRTISKVDMRVNGEFWKPMSKSSWGTWTSSYNTRTGVKVEFLATDSNGYISQSLPFLWRDGNNTKGSTTPGPTPTTTTPPPTTTTPPPTTTTPPPTTTTPPPTTTTPPPTTTTAGPFAATFQPQSNVNEWWIDVKVSANQPVARVQVMINGGAWTDLNKTGWGTWAKSLHAPKGSEVIFRATSSSGAQSTSQTFFWLSEGPPTWTVSFAPAAVGNDWWIEVKVTSNRNISLVETSINGAEWKPLELQSWKSWAKSYYTPNGSSVRFRATNTLGETAISDPTVWP